MPGAATTIGRPKGSGAWHVIVVAPRPRVRESGRVYVGKGLWMAAGSPLHVDLHRRGDELIIRSGGRYRVTTGRAGYLQPRLSIGAGPLRALGLRPGRYAGRLLAGDGVDDSKSNRCDIVAIVGLEDAPLAVPDWWHRLDHDERRRR